MGPGKLTSIGAAGAGGIVLAALLLTIAFGLWPATQVTVLTAVLAAAFGGALCGGIVHMAIGLRMDRRLQALRRDVHAAASHPDASIEAAGPYFAPLSDAINHALADFRQRLERLRGERRELEIQVRVADAERQHAEAILHSISDAVVVTDAFNEVAIANDAAARALKFALDGARHQPVDRIIADPTLAKLIKDTRECGNTSNRRHVEHRIGAEGRANVYDVTLTCVGNQHDEVAGVVTILHDITREKEISEMKSDFVSSVSHELRTPLSSIKAYVEMLVDGEANDEQTRAEFYNIIQSEANRLSRLIDNILNISRIESGIVKVQRDHISLPSVIKEVVDVMQPQARAKQIELTCRETPLFYQVYADKDMIYQATLNLVGNAIKYTPSGGKVTVDTAVDDHQRTVTVNVTDTGVGVPPDALPHLFEKFYRVNDHKKLAKGTGLGLNLVKHIVETVHGGAVAVTSEVGKGSTFRFSLPISDGSI